MFVSPLLTLVTALGGDGSIGTGAPDFARDVLPILSDRCFPCHGPDEGARKAGLRLDSRAGALAGGKSGLPAVVPGDVIGSELAARITETRARLRMPPESSGRSLDDDERATLLRWIESGAEWSVHWAWVAPRRPGLPAVQRDDPEWCREPLDRFVLARLEAEGLEPSPPADPVALLRRATLALTGLPPTPEEVDAFVAEVGRERAEGSARPDAWDRAIDRLLASPHYGERMVLPWLDAARYADSNGFQQDGDTHQWVWRDWLVRALNEDVPLDALVTRMLAGDLLPAESEAQRIDQQVATGLQRCHLLNGEGGAIPEEQRHVIVFDRVDVFATAFLGLTAACAQCHDHKFDPITQRDYYALFDFFNRVPESGVPPGGGQYRIADPAIEVVPARLAAELAALEAEAMAAEAAFEAALSEPDVAAARAAWDDRQRESARRLVLSPWEAAAPIPEVDYGQACEIAPDRAAGWEARPELRDGVVHPFTGDATAFYFRRTLRAAADLDVELRFGSDDSLRVWIDGRLHHERRVTRAAAPDQEITSARLAAGEHTLVMQITNGAGPAGFWFEARAGGLSSRLAALFATDPAALDGAAARELRDAFVASDASPRLVALRDRQAAARASIAELRARLPRVMVMSDAQPRETHVLARGNYESPLEPVEAAAPAFLPPLPDGAPRDRLGLARWLVAPENPLFARVMANRAWQHFFGDGIVRTSENLGVQGEPPSDPALLDWLAVGLREGGWSVKALHRSIVASATFRQSSRLAGARGAALLARDPENRLLARGPRRRLPAAVLRDVALAASGLLRPEIGGPPVYPYQPANAWDGLAITRERDFAYPLSSGADLFRRSLYTFWRRTVAPGNMFDSSARQSCQVRTPVTSTPLHALTMLNDPTWVEAGRALAQLVMQRESGLDARLSLAFRRVCSRTPQPEEIAVLRRTVERARERFAAGPAAAASYLGIGASPRDSTLDPVEHAALATACLTILNLDEAMTCE